MSFSIFTLTPLWPIHTYEADATKLNSTAQRG